MGSLPGLIDGAPGAVLGVRQQVAIGREDQRGRLMVQPLGHDKAALRVTVAGARYR